MKIAFVIQKLAGIRGGAERIAIETARAMQARGHDVTLISFEPANGPPGYDTGGVPVRNLFPFFSAEFRTDTGARPVAPPRPRRLEAAMKSVPNVFPLAQLKWMATHGFFARRLRAMIRAERPDIVIGVMKPAITAAAYAARGTGARVIASTHNLPSADYDNGERWDGNPVYRRRSIEAFDRVAAILVLLEEFRDWFPVRLRSRVTVMPNPICRLSTPGARPNRRSVILGVGRLTEVKQFSLLVAAWEKLHRRHPGWSVEICGVGPEHDALAAQIKRAGLAGHVRLLGNRIDIGARYDEASILCHPARFEGFGLAVGEALAHGVPVVAFADCPGVNRLIRNGSNGVLIESPDDRVDALAEALDRLIGSPDLREHYGRAGPESVAIYAPELIYDQWDRLVRDIAAGSAG